MVFQNKVNVVKYFLLIVFFSFCFCQKVNAATYTGTSVTRYRSYYFCTQDGVTSTCSNLTLNNQESVSGPNGDIMGMSNTTLQYVTGVSISGAIQGGSSSRTYHTISNYKITFKQKSYTYNGNTIKNNSVPGTAGALNPGQGRTEPFPRIYYYTQSGRSYLSLCSFNGSTEVSDGYESTYTCDGLTSGNNDPITSAVFTVGYTSNATLGGQYWGKTGRPIGLGALVFVNYTYESDSSSDYSGQMNIINNNITETNNLIEEQNEREQQAENNISNQSTSDIPNSENQATTNLIGIFSSFLTELQGFSATNCNLTLPFPQFIGGSQTVNICQGKDVLGNFITVIGTLAMVGFYIPLAIVLLKMIYNEIRSFTNG